MQALKMVPHHVQKALTDLPISILRYAKSKILQKTNYIYIH